MIDHVQNLTQEYYRTIPIPGFKTVAQVKENCAAMQFGPLSEDQMREIATLLDR